MNRENTENNFMISGPDQTITANFSLYYSPTTVMYGDNITYWGDFTWPRTFTRVKIIESYEFGNNVIFKSTYHRDYKPFSLKNVFWYIAHMFKKGDSFHISKRETPFFVNHNSRNMPKDAVLPGLYKARRVAFDDSGVMFVCMELGVTVKI